MRPLWGVARSSFFDRALSANLGPGRAIPIFQRSSNPRSQLLTRKTPPTWANQWNLEQASITKHCLPNPPVRYDTDCSTHFLSDWGQNSSVYRELDESITRPMDSLHYYRISTTPPMLAKVKSLCGQLKRGSEVDSSVRDTQVDKKGTVQTIKQSHAYMWLGLQKLSQIAQELNSN